jgi:hypothetical protein
MLAQKGVFHSESLLQQFLRALEACALALRLITPRKYVYREQLAQWPDDLPLPSQTDSNYFSVRTVQSSQKRIFGVTADGMRLDRCTSEYFYHAGKLNLWLQKVISRCKTVDT